MRLVALLISAAAGIAWAHEIGTTRVTARFPGDGTYAVEIATDASALMEKLQSVAGREGSLADFDETFRQRISLAFDDQAAAPAIAYSVTPAPNSSEAPSALIRLTGPVPSGAKQVKWKFGWTFATYSFTVQNRDTAWLEGGQTSSPIDLSGVAVHRSGRWGVIGQYLALGFTHILPLGLDHMLFVLGIYLLNSRARSVLMQVTAFTAAHSITLGLSMYGWVHVSPRVVEPLIALSIAYVAVENLLLSELKPWRVVLVFGFGLLHGLGFAGVLTELGLPRSEFLTALLSFNAGVEVAQLAVIGIAFVLVGWHFANREWYRRRIAIPASLLIACIAIYWTVERVWTDLV